jgi:hypothetical protein
VLRICALILCVLAAFTLNWTPAPRSQSPTQSVERFSLITIEIDRSQHFAVPNGLAESVLP